GATRLAGTLAPPKFGAVVVKTGATAESSGQSSQKIRLRQKLPGSRQQFSPVRARNNSAMASRKTSDYSPDAHEVREELF
ncbi:MAG TPA: hypothetical protein VMV89_07080, partial [Candidatus Paceibacterota bacterium]|nr:hypothetical protein [Candidatus Paceibacterota bacterium]